MKNIETVQKAGRRAHDPAMKSSPTHNPKVSAGSEGLKHFRRLKWDELVVTGDFIVNEKRGFEPWEGPSGFRADAFLKPIYRLKKRPARS
jgi:hypothetical protein